MKLHINEYNFLPDKKRTGQIINEIRKNNKLKLSQFADILCVDEKTVSKWISGYSFPNLYTLDIIRSKFNISLDELLLPNSKIDISIYNYFANEFKGFEKHEYTVINEFDENGYAINYIDVDKACNDLFDYRKKMILSDYLIQKNLFSTLNDNELMLAKKLGIEVGNESLKKMLYEKYGASYKISYNSNVKDNILFDMRKFLFTPIVDDATGIRLYSKRSWYLIHFLHYLLFSSNQRYHECLIDTLDDFEAELVYNALIYASIDETEYFMKLIKKRNPRKYKHIPMTIECNLQYLDRYNIKEDFAQFDPTEMDFRTDNIYSKGHNRLKFFAYCIYILGMLDCVASNNMDDFINFTQVKE